MKTSKHTGPSARVAAAAPGRRRRAALGALSILSSLCLAAMSALPCLAAEREGYTYTVVLHAGEQGTLSIADGASVSVDGGGSYEIQADADGKSVRITGLTAANHVRFLNSAVSLGEDSKYYVKGVRMGGRDNGTVSLSYFPVERDQDYVVAYGIKGDLTQYTVHYVDTAGDELLPPQVHYGNVGDKPVVAYLYIEGYQPQAYNLTRTLQKDYSKNIFTFVYSRIQEPAGPGGDGQAPGGATPPGGAGPGGAPPEGGGPEGGGEAPGGTGTPGTGGGAAPDGAGGPDGAAGDPEGGAAADPDAGPGQDVAPPEGGGPEEPGEPEDLEDLDDEETPMGGYEGGKDDGGTIAAANRARRRGTLLAGGIGIAAVLLLAAGLYAYRRMRKGQEGRSAEK